MGIKSDNKIIIAHRGSPRLAPELTLPSFRIACELGAPFIETDIQRTNDGILVNIHDDNLHRTTNVRDIYPGKIDEPVSSFKYKDLLKLDAGGWFNEKNSRIAKSEYYGLNIPTLEELIDMVYKDGSTGLIIELKKPEKYPGIEDDIVNILVKKGFIDRKTRLSPKGQRDRKKRDFLENRIILSSFNNLSLFKLKNIQPELRRIVIGNSKTINKSGGFDKFIKMAQELESDISLAANIASPWKINMAKKAGLKVFIYTINNFFLMKLFFGFKVNGIFTDRYDEMLRPFD